MSNTMEHAVPTLHTVRGSTLRRRQVLQLPLLDLRLELLNVVATAKPITIHLKNTIYK